MKKIDLINHFLIAMPGMGDPFFSSSVVYICRHDDQGALGVVLNKRSDLTLDDLLVSAGLHPVVVDGGHDTILCGGPVESNCGFVIHSFNKKWRSTLKVTEDIALTTSLDILEEINAGSCEDDTLISVGCSGWVSGQLEDEITRNYWLSVPAQPAILFETPIDRRFDAALALLGLTSDKLSLGGGRA